jgi:hypothetical protein
MANVDPLDERRHAPDGTELWNESYYLDWFTEDGTLGGYVRIGFVPHLHGSSGAVWYWACLVEEGGPLVTVIDHDVPLPRDDRSLEVRHEGLWADHDVPEPVERMSTNLESFAVALDDPADVYHGCRGERVPFGFELDWHTDRAAYQWPPVTPRYEIPCRVDGRVLVGDREIDVDAWGQRDHSWGAARDWWGMQWCWSAGRLEDGTRFHSAGGFSPELDLGIAYVLPAGSSDFVEATEVAVRSTIGREGLVDEARLTFGGLDLTVEPVAWSPVLLVHPDGREARFPRALARFRASDGRTGAGWIEFNQPPSAAG